MLYAALIGHEFRKIQKVDLRSTHCNVGYPNLAFEKYIDRESQITAGNRCLTKQSLL